MKIHMARIRGGLIGSSIYRGSLCGRLNKDARDGMNITMQPHEVTCGFCKRHNLTEAAKINAQHCVELGISS